MGLNIGIHCPSKRFISVCACFLVSLVATKNVAGQNDSSKPNIVFVLTDDVDFDELSVYDYRTFPCYTGAWAAGKYRGPDQDAYYQSVHWMNKGERPYFPNPTQWTPNLERLAREGMVFERFYSTTSACTPSRYGALTGRMASSNPALVSSTPTTEPLNILWNSPLAPGETNIAKEIKKLGYTTGLFGKWHNSIYRVGAKEPFTEEKTVFGVGLNDAPKDPKVLGKIRQGHADAVAHLTENIGFDKAGALYTGNKNRIGLPLSLQAHNPEWIFHEALNFIEEAKDQPFCLYICLTLPHRQNSVAENDENPLATTLGMLSERPDEVPDRDSLKKLAKDHGVSPQNFSSTWIDVCVGALLEKLDKLHLSENTLVVFTSDHQSRGKNNCYEGCRVPMIMRWPGVIPAGSKNADLCENIDLVPTFLDAAGSKSPAATCEGKSLLPLLRGKPVDGWRQYLCLEGGYSRAVVTKDWKYIANRPPLPVRNKMEADKQRSLAENKPRILGWDGINNGENKPGVWFGADVDFPAYFDEDQLYNLSKDPFEQDNLASDPKYKSELDKMKEFLHKALAPESHPFGEFAAVNLLR